MPVNSVTGEVDLLTLSNRPPFAVAAPTGIAATDTANLQAALNQVPATGGVVQLTAGTYAVNAALTITNPTTIVGVSQRATVITTSHATANIFTVTCPTACRFQSLTLDASVTRTGGAGISLSGSGGNANSFSLFDDLTINNQYIAIDTQAAQAWTIRKCYLVSYILVGVGVQNTISVDAGDSTITGCVFDAGANTGAYAVYQQSSGGLRLSNNKLLHGSVGYYCVLGAAASSTSILLVNGNSFENMATAIQFQRSSGTTTFGKVVITGNEFAINSAAHINVATAGTVFSDFVISGNYFENMGAGTSYCIVLTGGDQVTIAGNRFNGAGVSTAIGVSVGVNASNVHVFDNSFLNYPTAGNQLASSCTTCKILDLNGLAFANLPTAANGSMIYCTDGTIANPVASGGNGCIAKRLNGAWVGN